MGYGENGAARKDGGGVNTMILTPAEQSKLRSMTPSAENRSCVVGKCDFCGQLKNDLLPVDGDEHLDELVCAYCDSFLDESEEGL